MTTTSNLLWGALAIGVVTGMRSMLAPTMVSQALADRADIEGAGEPARTLASRQVRRYVMPLAAGELFGDKMPFAPDRTIAPSLLVRALSGGISAAALAGARRQPILLPALIGSSAACLAAKLAIDLRKRYGTNAWVNAGLAWPRTAWPCRWATPGCVEPCRIARTEVARRSPFTLPGRPRTPYLPQHERVRTSPGTNRPEPRRNSY